MRFLTVAVVASQLSLSALGRPASRIQKRQGQIVGSPNGPEIDNSNIPYAAVGPVGSSGDVYGDESLLGNAGDSASATVLGPGVPYATGAASNYVGDYTLAPGQTADADEGPYLDFSSNPNPQPIRGQNGATDPGPRNEAIQQQNPDALARPGTDSGDVPNAKWPMGLSSTRSGTGGGNPGWARQQNVNELPIATAMAGVDMRLAPNAYRELHWHSANEWSYIFTGSVRISAVNQNGETFVDDLQAGDLWFFPAGVPHSIQATEEGVEFLLVFNQGEFSEDDTNLVTELFLRNPTEVLAKNFQTDVSTFANLPSDQKYIFNGSPMEGTLEEARASVNGPAGELPSNQSYSYHWSAQAPYTVPGGSVKIVDPTTFPIANNFSVALFTIDPGAMREIHWHLTSDEWNFFLAGQGRVTVFTGPTNSRTFDYQEGDVGYIPVSSSHYVENTGSEPLVYMEVLQAPRYIDISAAQWLGLTPSQVVRETLNLPQSFIDTLPKTKRYIVPGDTNLTATNFTAAAYPNANLNATGAT
ncbi:hypothetical protein BAUCODRAFT_107856 [Baudoinia panamericana UAMH 10762]|uniref:Cupin type-1 domain-containing protein n=1 Tax=Baudoinia panamericana (strain UAMH 10762) TaxID=717646 RepID=M2MXM6_BAUPA|nr:uncharacterized protein BAUCODRAFT_107856 [Baudoinia panamericana UAMH 10762]EMC96323.1 hypothetical protein BAUCODRAFT_107856 [Baudoinia panamericana UAMH 10762]